VITAKEDWRAIDAFLVGDLRQQFRPGNDLPKMVDCLIGMFSLFGIGGLNIAKIADLMAESAKSMGETSHPKRAWPHLASEARSAFLQRNTN
jgi:hypothetical protein